MSKITIADLEVFFRVGVPAAERAKPQCLLVTLEMEFDFSSAARTDRITNTIDYHEVAKRIMKCGEGRSWKLIEKLATDVADLVLAEFHPQNVTVKVKKFPIPQARYVSVSVTRLGRVRGTFKRAASGIQ